MVLATTRIGRARRQAALFYARERRRSLLSAARLFATLELPEGGTFDSSDLDELAPITFEGVARYEGAGGPGGTIFDTGLYSLVTTATGLELVGPGPTTVAVEIGVGRVFRWNLAMRPGDAQVRFWIDSELRVRTTMGTAVQAWHADGTVTYDDTPRVTVLSPLTVYHLQRPRHFDESLFEAPVVPPVTDNDILLRAAIATFLTGSFPFVDNPDALP